MYSKIPSIYILLFFLSLRLHTEAQELIILSRALEIAALNSPDLQQSALSLERSQANLEAKNASLKSDFSLQLNPFDYSNQLKYDDRPGGDGWYNVQRTTSGGTFSVSQPVLITDATIGLTNSFRWQDANGDQSYYNNLTLRIDQPLFSHNQQKMALQKVKLDVENATLNYALQKLSMERSITSAFYTVYKRQIQVLISQEEYDNQQANHKIVRQKAQAGLLPLEELYQSEVNLISSETSLETAKVTLENAEDQLRLQLGLDFSFAFMTVVNVQVDSVPVNLHQAIARAMTVTQELRQREIDIEMAELSLINTIDNNSFNGKISFQMGLSGQDASLANIYDKASNNTGIGLSLEVPIWDWGKRKARIRSAQISLAQQELFLGQEQREIELKIRSLHRSLSSLLKQIETADRNVHNAQLTYDTNLQRYQNGKITSMNLQLVQNQLSQKKMAQTNAVINYKIELLNMKIQTLYDWEKREDFVPEELFSNLEL